MRRLLINLPERGYEVWVGAGLLDDAGARCRAALPRAGRVAVVTDTTVGPLYTPRLLNSLREAGFAAEALEIPAGEASKSVPMLERVYDFCMEQGLTRSDAVAALGGGVVGDLAGFAAATLLRGVDFVQIPTTLLAQVDSSVGGKVAVNLRAGKNLAGAFWQPRLVLTDPALLATLDDQTFADGMAEVVKYGCIQDAGFFAFLEQHPTRADIMADMEYVLYTCCDLKRTVVVEDERDTGARMILNFGHTLGHAYELAGGYRRWTHGQAVAAGMVKAARLGVALGRTPEGLPARIAALLGRFGLPTAISCTAGQYAAAIGLDKKGAGGIISLILLEALGQAAIVPLPKAELIKLLEGMEP